MPTTYTPGCYYGPKTHEGEVRLLLGDPATQSNLFVDELVLPKDGQWSYKVIWGEAKRVGQTFQCKGASFRKWGAPMADHRWWRRVDEGRIRCFRGLDLWYDLDADTVMQPGGECNCEYRDDTTVPAEALRSFLK